MASVAKTCRKRRLENECDDETKSKWLMLTGEKRRFLTASQDCFERHDVTDVFFTCTNDTYVIVGTAVFRQSVSNVIRAWLGSRLEDHRDHIKVTYHNMVFSGRKVFVQGVSYRHRDFLEECSPGVVESISRLVRTSIETYKWTSAAARQQLDRFRRIFETQTRTFDYLTEQKIGLVAHQAIYNTALRLRFCESRLAPEEMDDEWRECVNKAVELTYGATGLRSELRLHDEMLSYRSSRSLTPRDMKQLLQDQEQQREQEDEKLSAAAVEWRNTRERQRKIQLLTDMINHRLNVSWTFSVGRRCDVVAAFTNLPSYLCKQLTEYVNDNLKLEETVEPNGPSVNPYYIEQVFKLLPQRLRWGGTPFLLMDDEKLCGKQSKTVTYTICSAMQLRKFKPQFYSEVFLPDQAFSVLNFDVDAKGYSEGPLCELEKRVDCGELARFLVYCIHDALVPYFVYKACWGLSKTKEEETRSTLSRLRKPEMSLVGKVYTYRRHSASLHNKVSARLVWFPPLELCFPDVQALRKFLDCLQIAIEERASTSMTWVQASWFDFGPFASRKSCRLANACKGRGPDDVFTFRHVVNDVLYCRGDGEEESLYTMAAALSRQPVGLHRPTLGSPFTELALKNVWGVCSSGDTSLTSRQAFVSTLPLKEWRLEDVRALVSRLATLLQVHVEDLIVSRVPDSQTLAVRPSNCTTAVCPIHERKHHRASFEVRLVNTNLYPRCYHSDAPASLPRPDRETEYLRLEFKDPGNTLHLTLCKRSERKPRFKSSQPLIAPKPIL